MALNDLIIKQAKPKDKRYTLSDGHGLILEIWPNGEKYWIVRAWQNKKEKRKHIGKYPEMSLKEARITAIETRENIFNNRPVS